MTHHDFSSGSLLTFVFQYWVGEHQLEIDHVTDAVVHEKSPQFNASQKELYKQLFRVDRKKILAIQTCFSFFAECNLFVSSFNGHEVLGYFGLNVQSNPFE